jgi:hypothetical protein
VTSIGSTGPATVTATPVSTGPAVPAGRGGRAAAP